MKAQQGIIIQARTGSTRLPGKMVLPFFEEEGILAILLKRLKQSKLSHLPIVVATTTCGKDDVIQQIAEQCGCRCFRGSEEDVLARFIAAAECHQLSRIIRICADNPFLDMEALAILSELLDRNESDYIAYATCKRVPTMKTHYGFWAEGVALSALKKVVTLTDEKLYHEHVTNYIYAHETVFSVHLLPIPQAIEKNTSIRLTLDTPEDFTMQRQIFAHLKKEHKEIGINAVLAVLAAHPAYYDTMKEQIIQNSK